MAKQYKVKQGNTLKLLLIKTLTKNTALDLTGYTISAKLYDIGIIPAILDLTVEILDQDYQRGQYILSLTPTQTLALLDRAYTIGIDFTNTLTDEITSDPAIVLNVVTDYQRECL